MWNKYKTREIPHFLISSIGFGYFVYFSSIFFGGNLLLQYVNSMNWIMNVGLDSLEGTCCVGGLVLGVCLALVWHYIGISLYCMYMVIAM